MATGDESCTTPVISVIVPAFNAAATLAVQLEALSRQTLDEPWELIIADNGSTDETAQIARSWSDRLPLRVIDASARRGPAAARNVGVAASGAPLLAFCDADDMVADDWLTRVLAALRVDEFVAIGVRQRAVYSSRARPEYVTYAVYESMYLPSLVACGAGHMAVRTEIFRAVGGFDESMLTAEDHDLCYRVQLEGHPLAPHPEAIVTVNRRDKLAELFRQHYSWGANDDALRHKYAPVRLVLSRALAEGRIAPPDPAGVAVVPLDARVPRSDRVRHALRSPAQFAELCGRLWSRVSIRVVESVAFWAGRRAAVTDLTGPQIGAAVAEAYVARC
nr:glycosyltransferase [Microbacterium bovistercoris]